MKVLVVESPAKAKTINKYLGKDYHVLASFGHIRDLPARDGSVKPDEDFAMMWELDARGSKQVADIVKAVKGAEKLILATDPDREGEAISWHVLEALKEKKALKGIPVERVTFNAITKDSVQTALRNPREIDQSLVDAYLARRALDYLVGFTLSPVLWRKLPGARSAGRVQSVALRLVCDREMEIEKFKTQEYWTLLAALATSTHAHFDARLVGADGKKLTRLSIDSEADAAAFKRDLELASFKVASVESKPARRNPAPPFTTSTLQQEASRKLGLAPAQTMRLAQRLYEGVDIGGETIGIITYMRTDGVDMAPEAITEARSVIGKEYGAKYVPSTPRKYTVKAKNAQEAHEAIRPTNLDRLPKDVARHLDKEHARLYELIWTRTIASQMESAELERTTVDIDAQVGPRKLDLRATGQVIRFDGFLTLYQEGKDDEAEEDDKRLPQMSAGETLERKHITATQSFTEPPPRYSEASLVKRMEELGIGRPSTYASVLAVLREREYVRIDKRRLIPDNKGRIVTAFLESFFLRYVEYDFTANLEEKLDQVSNHELDWKKVLRDFWNDFSVAIAGTKELRIAQVVDALNDMLGPHIFPDKGDGTDPRACPKCGNGQLGMKLGKFGAFIGCSNYPECNYTRVLGTENGDGEGGSGTTELGTDPESGLDVSLRDGRYGPFVQLGAGEKPKRVTLPRGMAPSTVDLQRALALLNLPREIAKHPETGEPILANVGRFGPYVQHGKTYASLGKDEDILEIGANRAIDLIVERETSRGPNGAGAGRELGVEPGSEVTISVKKGRFGPYVSDGKVNATIGRGYDYDTISLEDALKLLAARRETLKSKPARGRAPARSKPAAKKAAPKKAAPKKDTAKKAAPKAATAKAATPKAIAAKAATPKKAAAKKPAAKKAIAKET